MDWRWELAIFIGFAIVFALFTWDDWKGWGDDVPDDYICPDCCCRKKESENKT